MVQSPNNGGKNRVKKFIVILGLLVSACIVFSIAVIAMTLYSTAQDRKEIRKNFGANVLDLCKEPRDQIIPDINKLYANGAGVGDIANLPASDQPLKVLVLNRQLGKYHRWDKNLPDSIHAKNNKSPYVLACVREYKDTVQICSYGHGTSASFTIERKQALVSVFVFNPQTGKLIATWKISGKSPDSCPGSVSGGGDYYGGDVPYDSFYTTLVNFLKDPAVDPAAAFSSSPVVISQVTATPVGSTAAPIPTIMPTSIPPTSIPAIMPTPPGCTPRQDWPRIVVMSGDTLFGIAERVGTTVDDLVAANCLANTTMIFVGQGLAVPVVPSPDSTETPVTTSNPNCQNQWFFTFTRAMADGLSACPGPVVTVSAIGEDFEGGHVYLYAAMPGAADPRSTIYVVYNNHTWESFADTWQSDQPESDPGIVPPTGYYQPVRSIGKVWRENPTLRQKLGWAYQPESSFTGHFQTLLDDTGNGNDGTPYFYLDRFTWGVVIRMDVIDGGTNTWKVAGSY